MFKKVKDEKLLKIQEQNMNEALSKITEKMNPQSVAEGGSSMESVIDEDEVIDILISLKT